MPYLDRDYSDRTITPVDALDGPYAHPFPIEQHRLGPFAPTEAFHKAFSKGK